MDGPWLGLKIKQNKDCHSFVSMHHGKDILTEVNEMIFLDIFGWRIENNLFIFIR